jgi:putative restriction endonuclease
MTSFPLSRSLEIGETLTQSEVEDAFNTNFGYQFKGITLRSLEEGRYVILLANKGEVYNDELGRNDEFTYEGEGVPDKGDQKATPANEALIDAVQDPLPIYLFTSEEGIDQYEYRGLVEVKDYSYVSDGERMVYRFEMNRLSVSSWDEYKQAETEVEELSRQPPSLTEDESRYATSRSRIRSSVFARKVKSRNDYACAVCGCRRFSPEGRPEVEAAHIYPKSEAGPDDPRNGIPLCKVHHWAFDCGWFSIDDNSEILVKDSSDDAPPDVVSVLDGEILSQQATDDISPHPTYLAGHRQLHGFE